MLRKIFQSPKKIGINVNLLIKHIGDIIRGQSESNCVKSFPNTLS